MAGLFATLVIIALVAALSLWLAARAQQAHTGLPINARIVYSDTGAWQKVERPLFSRRYYLTGKPDYIVEEAGTLIPIEVKPNRVATAPRESDVMQLAAYAWLIGETFGTTPAYGLLKYRDDVFQIDFTEELHAQLIDLLDAMREDFVAEDVARNHGEPPRCRACGYRAECDQVLE